MNSKLKRTISSIAAVATLFTNGLSASAETLVVDYNSIYDEDTSSYQYVTVDVTKAETYEVTLPKTITLDGSGDSASFDFKVKAEGDISSTHYVRVIPVGDVKLTNEDESVTMDLSVTQTKRRWDSEEAVANSGSNSTDGSVSVEELEPGEWTGKIKYYVSLDDGGIWTSATCTTAATCLGYDSNDNGILDDDELLDEPITKGSAKGHTFEDDTVTFPGLCSRCNKTVYVIKSAEQLVAFSTKVNNGNSFAGATIELGADIDLTGIDFTPIGKIGAYFNGNFDGHGYTISNLTLSGGMTSYLGLFGRVGGTYTSVIKNVNLKNVAITTTDNASSTDSGTGGAPYVGAIVACCSDGASSTSSTSGDGYGSISVEITGCTVDGLNVHLATPNNSSKPYNVYVGGIYGDSYVRSSSYTSTVVLTNNSVTNSSVTCDGSKYSAYIAGIAYSSATTVKNNFASMSVVVANPSGAKIYGITSSNFTADGVENNVIDSTVMPNVIASSYNYAYSTDECKSDTAVAVLNTNTSYTWALDLEGTHSYYPYVKNK